MLLRRAVVTAKHRVRRRRPPRHCSVEECDGTGEERIARRRAHQISGANSPQSIRAVAFTTRLRLKNWWLHWRPAAEHTRRRIYDAAGR
jgi:hypothetical protein